MIVLKPEEIENKLKDYISNLEYLRKNFKKIIKKYSGKYIAIKDSRVIASSKSEKKLFKILERRKIYYADCVIALIGKYGVVVLP